MGHQRPRYRIPDELRQTLLDMTVAYLMERPTNIVDFGLDFFQRLKQRHGGEASGGGGGDRAQPGGTGQIKSDKNNGNHHSVDHGDVSQPDFSLNDVTAPPVKRSKDGGRRSVFAEMYNPEEDEGYENPVHEKTDAQREKLNAAGKHILLFRSLEPEQLKAVIDAMFPKTVKEGEIVIQQGDDGDNFYVIESGKYTAIVEAEGGSDQKVVHKYDGEGSFGELALMYNMPRAATVKAETDGNLWALNRETFRKIILHQAYEKRKMYSAFIETVPMLSQLDEYERMNLADALQPRFFGDGDIIFKQGDVADGMYFVEDGEVRISTKADENGEEKEINRSSKGGYFGELALLTNTPRAATATSIGAVKLAFLDVDVFERLLGACMDIMKRNAEEYQQNLIRIIGSQLEMTHLRQSTS